MYCWLAPEMAFIVPPGQKPSTLHETLSTSFDDGHFLILGRNGLTLDDREIFGLDTAAGALG